MTKESTTNIKSFLATLNGKEHEVPLIDGESMLVSMIAKGLQPTYQCQVGKCTSCIVKVESGKVKMENNEALSDRDIQAGYTLLCQAHPLTADVSVFCDDD